jgi:hypothetical protein
MARHYIDDFTQLLLLDMRFYDSMGDAPPR